MTSHCIPDVIWALGSAYVSGKMTDFTLHILNDLIGAQLSWQVSHKLVWLVPNVMTIKSYYTADPRLKPGYTDSQMLFFPLFLHHLPTTES